jgi:vitamin B12 transporter
VADVLRGTPGLDVERSGGPGQITSVFMRGADSDHTLVLIDGIEANDPSSPSRAFDFSTLTTDDIQQIEVIRGPQSSLWGSNAIGGVINIVTKRGEGPLTGYVSSEAGSFNTYRESAGFSGGTKFVNYSLSVTENDSQGFPAADAKYGNHTPDSYDNTSFASRVGVNLSDTFSIDLITRYQDNRVRIDDGGGPDENDPNRWLKSENEFLRIQPHLVLFDGVLVQTYGFNYTHYVRDDTDPFAPNQSVGSVLKFDFQNDIHVCKNNTATAGVDLYEEGYRGTGVPQKYANSAGIFLQDQASFADSLFLALGSRYEDNSLVGSNFTYRATGAYLFPTNTKLHASFGTGFKSPTLSDLYSSYGSRSLKPEQSQGWDAGVEQSFFERRVVVDATYFNNHFTDLIDYDYISNHEENIGEARAQGVELGSAIRPTDRLTLGANYTYTDTEDETTRLSLLRRAPNKIGAFANYQYCPQGDVTLTVNYVSSRADIDPVTFNQIRLGGYTLVNLATSYKVTNNFELTARIDNLLNQHYEDVAGYGTADISFYGGFKLSF